MCSRYRVDATAKALAERFGAHPPPGYEPGGEIALGAEAPVLILAPERRFTRLKFGLKPSWAGEDGKPVLNARADKSLRRLSRADGALFAFAGLWEPGCFAVVTVDPNPLVRAIHDRMPALLAQADEAAWLDPKTPPDRLAALLIPFPSEQLACGFAEAQPQGDLFA